MSKNIQKIVEGIKNGDEQSFNVLFNKYYRRLHYFADQYVQDSSEAEGLVQETFMTLWKKSGDLKCTDESGLLSWLYTVLKNNCYRHIKWHKSQMELNDQLLHDQMQLDLEGLSELDTSEETFDNIYGIIKQTMEQLPPRCAQVFEMSRFEGLKNKEIAEALGITEKAVEGNITRAIKVLRIALQAYLPHVLVFIDL